MRTSTVLLPVFLIGLSGCVAPAIKGAPAGFEASGISDGGCVVGSIGQNLAGDSLSPFQFSKLIYGPRGEQSEATIRFGLNGLNDTPIDFKEPKQVVSVFRLCLKAGMYEFRDVLFHFNNGTFDKKISAEVPFSLPFEVKNGSVQYIGRFISHGIKAKNRLLSLNTPVGGYFTVEDASKQDWAMLRTRDPSLPTSPTLAVIEPTRETFPFIVKKADSPTAP